MSDFIAHVEDLQKNNFETASSVGKFKKKDTEFNNNENNRSIDLKNINKEDDENKDENIKQYKFFDINEFASELKLKSSIDNKYKIGMSSNITAYDVAANCIRQIVYKIRKTPVPDYSAKWLPIFLRSQIGNACHDFIQNYSNQFTESEISIKVPSIRFSGRIDNMIGSEIIVEIKTSTYKDYADIIKYKTPKLEHFRQALTYKYILENYLDEIKNPNIRVRSNKPKYSKYNIKYIQFIYLAHDVIAADMEDISSSLKAVDTVKKQLKDILKNRDDFKFMTSLTINTDNYPVVNKQLDFIKNKIKDINYYIDSSKLPMENDPFIKKSDCHFCIFNQICDLVKIK